MCQTPRQRAKLRAVDLAVGDLVIDCDVVIHPLLGDAFIICNAAGEPLTAMSAVDLDRPTEIPAIAEPALLPHGSGALLLNLIAKRAPHPLRYAGPYPTPALYRSLLRSFRASGDEDTFCHDVMDRALRLARDPIPIEFTPAPHERVTFERGFVEVRDGAERAVIDRVSYELVAGRAETFFGIHVATFSPTGALVEGPYPIPAFASDVIGKEFPAELRELLGELVPVPGALAHAASVLLSRRTLAWADLGALPARESATGFEVHAAIWQPERGMDRVAIAIAEALAPVVTRTIVALLAPRLPA
jgi:hypothetical protein